MKENLMVVCYDFALARRISVSLSGFLEMRYFDMFDMFRFNNAPHSLSEILKINGMEYAIKEMRSVLKTELDFSGAVFVAEPKMLQLNRDLFERMKESNLVLFLKNDYKSDYVVREKSLFKSEEDKNFFALQIDEVTEIGNDIETNLADLVVNIEGLTYEQIKEKVQNALENYSG